MLRILYIILLIICGCSQSVEVPTVAPADQTCPDGRCPYLEPRQTKEGFLKV